MSASKINYEELKPFIPQNGNEENYALLTQYLLMKRGDGKKARKEELVQRFGFEDGGAMTYRTKH